MRRGGDEKGGRRGRSRAVLRFVAAVMTTSGVLLLADAGMTLLWQEPISGLIALREQSILEEQLGTEEAVATGLTSEKLARLARRHERQTETGAAWGRIELPKPDRDFVVVQGTDEASLRKGPGHYPETALPGEGSTVAIAGHRTTYLAPFNTIDRLDKGDEIVLELPYARFTYKFQKSKIVEPTRTSVLHETNYERLVLSACHPLYSAAQRIVVFAKLRDVRPA